MRNLKLRLITTAFLSYFCLMLISGNLYAQPDAAAVPVPDVEAEAVDVKRKGVVIIELFSSQACAFCPQADRLFSDLSLQSDVIALACHVDYFDVRKGSLAQDFCTKRQDFYMKKLLAGPNYTPQLVINGHYDVVGYKLEKVTDSLNKARMNGVDYLSVAPVVYETSMDDGVYNIGIPEALRAKIKAGETTKFWLALYDKPHDIIIPEGRNKGRAVTYDRIISVLEELDLPKDGVAYKVKPPLQDLHQGFAVLVQDQESGRIMAAGRYDLPETKTDIRSEIIPEATPGITQEILSEPMPELTMEEAPIELPAESPTEDVLPIDRNNPVAVDPLGSDEVLPDPSELQSVPW